MNKRMDTRTVVVLGMLSALAYLAVVIFRLPLIPAVPFLHYEPKDVVLTVGALLYGPLPGACMAVVVSLIEMITVSTTGPIGFLMNVISSCAFLLPPAVIYRRRSTLPAALVGLGLGVVSMSCVMLLWNWLISPLYMGISREAVAALLLPAFLPFNLLKGGLNAAITMLLYKPVVAGLSRTRLLREAHPSLSGKRTLGVVLLSAVLLVTLCLTILAINGKI